MLCAVLRVQKIDFVSVLLGTKSMVLDTHFTTILRQLNLVRAPWYSQADHRLPSAPIWVHRRSDWRLTLQHNLHICMHILSLPLSAPCVNVRNFVIVVKGIFVVEPCPKRLNSAALAFPESWWSWTLCLIRRRNLRRICQMLHRVPLGRSLRQRFLSPLLLLRL